MASRQGRIALQLTQWVGGTIIVLMFTFILADYAVQSRAFGQYRDDIAVQGAEGLKSFLERPVPLEETLADLRSAATIADYCETGDHDFAVFNSRGEVLIKTAGALSSDPEENRKILVAPSGEGIDVRSVQVGEWKAVVGVGAYTTRDEPAETGTVAYVTSSSRHQAMALMLWGVRSAMVLLMIAGTMVAVRIPVKKFVVAPIDGLFMAAYAASRDDFHKLPPCPCDNEFTELYEMFDRLMGHLSDTRIHDALVETEEELRDLPEEPV